MTGHSIVWVDDATGETINGIELGASVFAEWLLPSVGDEIEVFLRDPRGPLSDLPPEKTKNIYGTCVGRKVVNAQWGVLGQRDSAHRIYIRVRLKED